MNVSDAGRAAITSREGRRLTAYPDPGTGGEPWTIGVGHTGRMSPPKVSPGMRITPEQCDAFLAADLAPVEAAIDGLGVALTQNQFDALASFAFNIGVTAFERSTVVSCLENGLFANAADALMNWCKPAILETRREAERRQFLTPDAALVAGRPIPSSAAPVVAEALNPPSDQKGKTIMTAPAKTAGASANPAAKPAAKAAAAHDAGHVNILAGIGNIFGTVVSSIESAISVAASPAVPGVQAGQPVTVGTSSGQLGAVFGSIQDAETAVSEINQVIADAKAGRWTEEPEDVMALLKTVFGILSRFGINVPVVSAIVGALPGLPAVTPAAA